MKYKLGKTVWVADGFGFFYKKYYLTESELLDFGATPLEEETDVKQIEELHFTVVTEKERQMEMKINELVNVVNTLLKERKA